MPLLGLGSQCLNGYQRLLPHTLRSSPSSVGCVCIRLLSTRARWKMEARDILRQILGQGRGAEHDLSALIRVGVVPIGEADPVLLPRG